MTDIDLIRRKLAFIVSELSVLKTYRSFSAEDLKKDYMVHTFIERSLERIVNAAIDINTHILAEKTNLTHKTPRTYKDTFEELNLFGIYPAYFGEKIAKSAGLRNILVHEYEGLDEKLFYESFLACLEEYPRYCDYIDAFLKRG